MPEVSDSSEQNAGSTDPKLEKAFRDTEKFVWLVLFTILAATVIQSQSFLSMLQAPPHLSQLPRYVFQMMLFIELLALSIAWPAHTHFEFELWVRWLDTTGYQPRSSEIYVAMFGLAVVLGLMFVFVYNIVSITLYVTLYLCFNIWTQKIANRSFYKLLQDTRTRGLSKERERVLYIMEQYWLKRPQVARIAIMAVFAALAFVLAVAGNYAPKPEGEQLQLMAYGALVVTLLFGDGLVFYWRKQRDREIDSLGVEEAQRTVDNSDEASMRVLGAVLACFPILSFGAQYLFSVRAGTQGLMFRHLTVTFVDWIFVPFNYFVARAIDWTRGVRIYLLLCGSTVLAIVGTAYWQQNALDPGHMITRDGVMLSAGWAHLAFSIVEMSLLAAFVFCRIESAAGHQIILTVLATGYFVAMGACGFAMHHRLVMSDAIAVALGLFFVLAYPRLEIRVRH